MQAGLPDVVVAAVQTAERAVRRAAGPGAGGPPRLVACDHLDLDGATVTRTTSVWQLPRATWRAVVDSAGRDGEPEHTVVEVADAAGPGRGVRGWDERYRERGGPAEPHPAVVGATAGVAPGTALDIACGTGRHSLWLAEQGWQVTALDFSRVGLDALAHAAAERGLAVDVRLGDARAWTPPDGATFDLVLLTFVHLPEVLADATSWVAPGGRLLVVGHSARTPEGTGPSDRRLLLDRIDLAARVTGARLRVLRASEVERETTEGTTTDVVLLAVRP